MNYVLKENLHEMPLIRVNVHRELEAIFSVHYMN